MKSIDVLQVLADLFVERGVPAYIRSDNGPEFTAGSIREWLARVEVDALFIEPGSPWENGYVESFNGKFRDELLNGEIFYTLTEAQILIERWRREYNTIRPHSSLGYRPPAPEAMLPCRVAGGDCSPPALTEPDLWTTHPALQIDISSAEQLELSTRDPLRWVQSVPL
jgi:hypothetical protein